MLVTDILGGLLGPLKDVIGEVVVNPNDKIKVNLALAQLEDTAQARLDAMVSGQIDVDKIEAASGSVFVAGWRPFVGWVSGVGLGYTLLVEPLLSWVARVCFHYPGSFPCLDNQTLMWALGGMLGIGAMRTVEKVKGVSTNNMTDVPSRVIPQTEETKKPEVVPPAPKKHFHIF